MSHIPVLLDEMLNCLNPQDGAIYLDCTFGSGGYTKAILNKANCSVIGIDRDENTKIFADKIENKNFKWFNIKFSEIDKLNIMFDGIVFDLGVSSMQIDSAERGFSFQKNAKLDMRMGKNNISAHDIINNTGEGNLADIIYRYGDEVKSRHIAREIIKNRPIENTLELSNIVRKFYPKKNKIDPATKTFQAIRIAVNDELNELKKALNLSKKLLNKNGKIVTVSFHSLEDKLIKEFMNGLINKEKKDKYKKQDDNWILLTKKIISPSLIEIEKNVRSRSAKLRAIMKNC
jgi:16S rRNA (cytosine1402-N4)-methyltransferase